MTRSYQVRHVAVVVSSTLLLSCASLSHINHFLPSRRPPFLVQQLGIIISIYLSHARMHAHGAQEGRKKRDKVECANCAIAKPKKQFPKAEWKKDGGRCKKCFQVKDSETIVSVAVTCVTCQFRFTRHVPREAGARDTFDDRKCELCISKDRKRGGSDDVEQEGMGSQRSEKKARKDPPPSAVLKSD